MSAELEARLLELYQNRTITSEEPVGASCFGRICPNASLLTDPELVSAVQSSLRRKVASLEDDNWIYEAEKEVPS